MSIDSPRRNPSPRVIHFIGQEFSTALRGHRLVPASFVNQAGGSFEVKRLAQGALAQPRCHSVSRAPQPPQFPYGARLNGDSNTVGSLWNIPTASSVFVQALDELECSWQITSYTTEQPFHRDSFGERTSTQDDPRVMRLGKGQGSKLPEVALGDFPMPFQATISIIGNKPGCPLP